MLWILLWLSIEPQRCVVECAIDRMSSPFVIELRGDKVVRIPIDWELYHRHPQWSHHPIERLFPLPKHPVD